MTLDCGTHLEFVEQVVLEFVLERCSGAPLVRGVLLEVPECLRMQGHQIVPSVSATRQSSRMWIWIW